MRALIILFALFLSPGLLPGQQNLANIAFPSSKTVIMRGEARQLLGHILGRPDLRYQNPIGKLLHHAAFNLRDLEDQIYFDEELYRLSFFGWGFQPYFMPDLPGTRLTPFDLQLSLRGAAQTANDDFERAVRLLPVAR